jgi:hypothetical protein
LSWPGKACDVVRRLALVAVPHYVKDEATLKTQ